MKKLFSFLICIFIVSQVMGQWSVGPRAGVNFCVTKGKWSDGDETKYKWIGAPTAGATVGYQFNDNFGLFADVSYIKMGSITEYTWEETVRHQYEVAETIKERYNSLQLAIRAAYIYNIRSLILLCYLAPYLTTKFGGRAIINSGGQITVLAILWDVYPARGDDGNYYVDPEYNRRVDAGLYIGGALGKDLGPGRLELDLRYGFGLVDLNKFSSREERKDAREGGYKAYRSMNACITVAYLIKLGKE
jgi:hypothetical protein